MSDSRGLDYWTELKLAPGTTGAISALVGTVSVWYLPVSVCDCNGAREMFSRRCAAKVRKLAIGSQRNRWISEICCALLGSNPGRRGRRHAGRLIRVFNVHPVTPFEV